MQLELGANRAFICNGTVAGNSSSGLQWEIYNPDQPSSGFPLPQVPSQQELSPADLIAGTLQDLCQGLSGAYFLPLRSFLAPNSSGITVGPSGAIFLHLRTALVICGASPSVTNIYSCFPTNTREENEYRVFLTLSVPSAVASYVIGVVVGIVALTLLVLLAIVFVCWWRYHSKKRDPLPMERESAIPVHRPSIMNPSFTTFDDATPPLEFDRTKLEFLSILGECWYRLSVGTI